MTTISQIFAKSDNDVIGIDNQLAWKLPNDMKFFKTKTSGHPIIMGRKTFESFGKPLPGRTNIVVSRNPGLKIEGCIVVSDIQAALQTAKQEDPREIFFIGGAAVFSESLPLVTKIYLTEVKAQVQGNVFYHFDKAGWKEVWREDHFKDEKHAYDFSFLELVRSNA